MMDPLNFLVFDSSDDADGRVCLEAMASVSAAQLPALQAELAAVLRWCEAHGGPRGPVDEGGAWDVSLHGSQERHRAEDWDWDSRSGRWTLQAQGPEAVRHTVTLTLIGSPDWAQALTAAFGLNAD